MARYAPLTMFDSLTIIVPPCRDRSQRCGFRRLAAPGNDRSQHVFHGCLDRSHSGRVCQWRTCGLRASRSRRHRLLGLRGTPYSSDHPTISCTPSSCRSRAAAAAVFGGGPVDSAGFPSSSFIHEQERSPGPSPSRCSIDARRGVSDVWRLRHGNARRA